MSLTFIYDLLLSLQAPESKFALRQTEVTTAGLFSSEDKFKQLVGPTAKPSVQDKWCESAAALTKAVAACTKAAQKPAPKKQPAKPNNSKKQAAKPTTPGKKRNNRNKSTKGKKPAKAASSAAAAAATTKKATEKATE